MLKTLKPRMVILHTKFNSNYDRKSRKRKCRIGLACVRYPKPSTSWNVLFEIRGKDGNL